MIDGAADDPAQRAVPWLTVNAGHRRALRRFPEPIEEPAMNLRLSTLTLLLGLAITLPAIAQDAPEDDAATATPPPAASMRAAHRGGGHLQERFDAADGNHDGKLSRDEAKAFPWVAKHFDQIDTDHDGYVTIAEIKAAHRQMMAARKARQAQQAGSAATDAPPPASN